MSAHLFIDKRILLVFCDNQRVYLPSYSFGGRIGVQC